MRRRNVPMWIATVLVLAGLPAVALAGPAAAAGPATTFEGGDLVTLDRPVTVRPSTASRVATAWQTVDIATASALPPTGMGSAVLSVTASGAGAPGMVRVRPTGATSAGATALSFTTAASTATTVTKLGPGGRVQIRTTAGSPRVQVDLVGWVPETAPLVLPAAPPAATTVPLSRTATPVSVAGRGGVPAGVSAVLVSVTTTGTTAGTLTMWTPGAAAPTTGDRFPTGRHTALRVVRPSSAGAVSLRALSGAGSASVQVLGWAADAGTLVPADAPALVASVPATQTRTITVRGVAGVPAEAVDGVVLAVSTAARSTVQVWRDAAVGAAHQQFTSNGGAVTVVVPLAADGSITVRASQAAQLVVLGWQSQAGQQRVSFVPKAGTQLLGPADVVSQGAGTVTVGPSADPATIGGHVLVRPPGVSPYLARVTSVDGLTGGNRRLGLAPADLHAAFDDYRVGYAGHTTQPVGGAGALDTDRSGADSTAATVPGLFPPPSSVALSMFAGEHWSCGEAVDPRSILDFSVEYSGNVNLDYSLSERRIDFSAKGGLQATLTINNDDSVYCTLTTDLPIPSIPIGTTGLALSFGGTGKVTVSSHAPDQGSITLTGAVRTYAAFWYEGGQSVQDSTMDTSGDVEMHADDISASLDLGVSVSVGPARVPGLDEVVDASASLTFGLNYTIGRPAHEHAAGWYEGPSCYDVTNSPFFEVGVGVVAPLIPDVDVTLARQDFAPVTFYRGPCYGYTGTITYTEKVDETYGCNPNCMVWRENRAVTLTMAPEAAVFASNGLLQSHSWQGSISTSHGNGTGCSTRVLGEGSGSEDWSSPTTTSPRTGLLSYGNAEPRTQQLGAAGIQSWNVRHAVTETASCTGLEPSERSVPYDQFFSSWYDPVPVSSPEQLWDLPVISIDSSHQPDAGNWPSWTVTAKINLVRQEFAR